MHNLAWSSDHSLWAMPASAVQHIPGFISYCLSRPSAANPGMAGDFRYPDYRGGEPHLAVSSSDLQSSRHTCKANRASVLLIRITACQQARGCMSASLFPGKNCEMRLCLWLQKGMAVWMTTFSLSHTILHLCTGGSHTGSGLCIPAWSLTIHIWS